MTAAPLHPRPPLAVGSSPPAAPAPAPARPDLSAPTRTLVVWCPDWPVRAWGVPSHQPAAVLEANEVTACSPAARRAGVRPGLRRREAQARCPDLIVLGRDHAQEARAFEPVVAAVSAFSPLVEVQHPGMCALATRGPSRYFGGDEALAGAIAAAVGEALVSSAGEPGDGRSAGLGGCRLGVADGAFAASWAARWPGQPSAGSVAGPGGPRAGPGGRDPGGRGTGGPGGRGAGGPRGGAAGALPVGVVPPGGSAAFLAPLPLGCLEAPDLVEVLWQLGLRTLGDFAALPAADVLARFGADAARRHRVARGLEDRPLDARRPPPDLAASLDLDPPAERVDQAAFAAKALADRLSEQLVSRGLACTRLAVRAETCHGEVLLRLWRHEGVLGPTAMAERVRWQLEGWLVASPAAQPTGGLSRLTLAPDEVVPARGRQLGFWGGETQAAERAARAAARVAAMVGTERVAVAERRGGRTPDEQFELVPVATLDLTDRSAPAPTSVPWPGQVPLAPASVPSPPLPVEVVAADGEPVVVSGRGLISAPPARVDGTRVVAWAGPWPLEERWWDGPRARRQARFQVVLADGGAQLLVVDGGHWWCVGTYD